MMSESYYDYPQQWGRRTNAQKQDDWFKAKLKKMVSKVTSPTDHKGEQRGNEKNPLCEFKFTSWTEINQERNINLHHEENTEDAETNT